MAAVGMGAMSVPLLSPAAHASPVPRPHARPVPRSHAGVSPADVPAVDLYVLTNPVQVADDDTGTLTIKVGNYGTGATANPAKLRVISPFYVNFGSLPTGFTYLLHNAAPNVQSIVEYDVPAPINSGSSVTVSLPVVLLAGGPNKPAFGHATIAGDPADNDLVADHNQQGFSVSRPTATFNNVTNGTVNVYHYDETVPLKSGGNGTLNFKVNNALGTTTRPLTVTLSTPYYVNFGNLGGLGLVAFSPTMVYTNSDPAVPSVAQFTIQTHLPGLLGFPVVLPVPLTLVSGGPGGLRLGDAITVTTAPDVDTDLSTSHHPFGVMALV